MEIRKGLIYLRNTREIVGCVDGTIPENKVSSIDPATIHDKLATKAMMFIITTMDGAVFPLCFQPTNTATGDWFYKKVSISWLYYFVYLYFVFACFVIS